MLVPDKSSRINSYYAGGTLTYGIIVHQLIHCSPALVVDNFPLKNGEHGDTAPEGADSDFGKCNEQIK